MRCSFDAETKFVVSRPQTHKEKCKKPFTYVKTWIRVIAYVTRTIINNLLTPHSNKIGSAVLVVWRYIHTDWWSYYCSFWICRSRMSDDKRWKLYLKLVSFEPKRSPTFWDFRTYWYTNRFKFFNVRTLTLKASERS